MFGYIITPQCIYSVGFRRIKYGFNMHYLPVDISVGALDSANVMSTTSMHVGVFVGECICMSV